ncbi:MAG: hypothetical protein EBT68_05295 [Verrucomicrobia bacterium]|nr:hypothetical protein [Verrucomicrobiota bacterium]
MPPEEVAATTAKEPSCDHGQRAILHQGPGILPRAVEVHPDRRLREIVQNRISNRRNRTGGKKVEKNEKFHGKKMSFSSRVSRC